MSNQVMSKIKQKPEKTNGTHTPSKLNKTNI